MKLTYLIAFIPLSLFIAGCSKQAAQAPSPVAVGYSQGAVNSSLSEEKPVREVILEPLKPESMVLRATAFRMNGNFEDNVAVTIGPDGNLLYFPDPKDISADSKPISLGDGWWLNRQGIGPNSVFTTYTFAQYAALPAVPSLQQLKNAIIPGSRITQFVELPVSASQAIQNIDEIKKCLKNYE